jgi:hypothetical protein
MGQSYEPPSTRPRDTSEAQHTDRRIPAFDHTLPFHIGGDVALGFDRGGSGLVFVVVAILLVMACGTLVLAERRSGRVIMFLGGLAALGMPIIHRNNGFTAAVAKSPGGLFFIWTLMALGVTGGLAMILSARGLWNLRSRKT